MVEYCIICQYITIYLCNESRSGSFFDGENSIIVFGIIVQYTPVSFLVTAFKPEVFLLIDQFRSLLYVLLLFFSRLKSGTGRESR